MCAGPALAACQIALVLFRPPLLQRSSVEKAGLHQRQAVRGKDVCNRPLAADGARDRVRRLERDCARPPICVLFRVARQLGCEACCQQFGQRACISSRQTRSRSIDGHANRHERVFDESPRTSDDPNPEQRRQRCFGRSHDSDWHCLVGQLRVDRAEPPRVTRTARLGAGRNAEVDSLSAGVGGNRS